MKNFALWMVVLAACGGDDGNMQTVMDAPANTNKVQAVTCPSAVDGNVLTTSTVDAYMPMTQTVPLNAVVKFTMASVHNVAPNTVGSTDPGLVVVFGQTKCLKFTQAWTYGFFCTAHSFAGTVTIQ